MHPQRSINVDPASIASQRRRAVRTALALGSIAVAIYVAFILSGVFVS